MKGGIQQRRDASRCPHPWDRLEAEGEEGGWLEELSVVLGSCWDAMVGRGTGPWGKELAAVWEHPPKPQWERGEPPAERAPWSQPQEGSATAVCWSKGRCFPLGQLLLWRMQGKGEAGAKA